MWDITSNGPKCGNSINKVYFTFNFDIQCNDLFKALSYYLHD